MTSTATADGDRLNRFLARRGIASRRAADDLIAAGRVTVNGEVAQLGARIDSNADTVTVDGSAVATTLPSAVTLALHKPIGVVTTMHDPQGRRTVRDLLPDIAGLVPVGRLDADSRGLLLLTTDGELAHRIAHPRHGIHKTYRVTLAEPATDEQLRRMVEGVELDDGPARALAVHDLDRRTLLEVVMGEGRKRVVRRLVAAAGNRVDDLCRTAVGPIELGDLGEGGHRALSDAEVAVLANTVGAAPGGR